MSNPPLVRGGVGVAMMMLGSKGVGVGDFGGKWKPKNPGWKKRGDEQ